MHFIEVMVTKVMKKVVMNGSRLKVRDDYSPIAIISPPH